MDIDSLVQALFGSKRAETQEVSTDGTTRTYTGVALTDSEDGTVVIDLGGDVTLPDDLYDSDGNVVAEWDGVGVEMPTSPQVSAGDDVIVTLMGGSATKTPMVTSSAGSGDRMRTLANSAKTVADAAQAVAEAVNQHFFADTNGIHVTEVTQEDWDESHTGANVLINSIGQLFRDGLNNLLTLTTENGARALTIWDGLGNAASNVLAMFGANETHLGLGDGISSVYLANDKFRMRGVTQERTPISGSGIHYETYGNILAETVWDGPSQDEHWDPETGYSYVSRASIDTYALVPGNEANLKLAASARSWKGQSPQASGSDPFDPYITPTTSYGAVIELHAGDTDDNYVELRAPLVQLRADNVVTNDDTAINGVPYPAPSATYTGSSGTATASTAGWQRTWFNSVVSSVGTTSDYFANSNGTITARRDCVLEISGVMNWTDALQGNRGFGIFESEFVENGTEHSVFQNFPSTISARKSVVFPPKLFTLTAGDSLTFGRYQQANAVYQNGTNYSWITIRVVG